jgi:hypothetical protein
MPPASPPDHVAPVAKRKAQPLAWVGWAVLLALNGLPVAFMVALGAAGMATTNASKIVPAMAVVMLGFVSVSVLSGYLVARGRWAHGLLATFLVIPVHFTVGAIALQFLE